MKTYQWILIAVLTHLIASMTNLSTGHPDEWFQTVEFGNFMAFGFISQTQEFFLHMRNLSWPAVLAGSLRLAQMLAPGSVAAKMSAIKLTTAVLDLSILWALAEVFRKEKITPRWKNFAWALFILPWFLVGDSVRPSQEHLSIIAFWWAIGFLSVENPTRICSVLAGIALVMTGAFRYPSGLFSAGAMIAVLVSAALGRRKATSLPWIFFGLLIGSGLGGLADYIYYGRPWESLWMYLQYNVFTGLSSSHFGTQSGLEYLTYFRGALGLLLIPTGVLSMVGLVSGLLQFEPWAYGLLAYLGGHLWIAHKEPRFMMPTLTLMLWAGFQGAWEIHSRIPSPKWAVSIKKPIQALVVLILLTNGVFLLRALWGETFRASFNYLTISELLKAHPACAIVTVKKPVSTFMPWRDPGQVPEPPLAYFPAPAHEPSSPSLKNRPLIWIERAPRCDPGSMILVQPQKPEDFWIQKSGCTLQSTGLARYLPDRWLSAPWYLCPSQTLALFEKPEIRRIIAHKLPEIEKLPRYGVSAAEFLTQTSLPPFADGTIGDW